MERMESKTGTYGLMAEFRDGDALLKAATRSYETGYRQIDAFSPFPIHGLAEAMGHSDRNVQRAVLGGGLFGLVAGYGLCYWTSVTEGIGGIFSGYAHNIGGRPLHSWPSFIIPTFETTILFAAITAVASMIAFNGLPMPYHPVFNVERFREHASTDGFFLCIESADAKFDADRTREFLASLGASEVNDVAH